MDDVSLSAEDPAQPGAAPTTAPRAHRRVLADFFQGRSRASYKRSWNVDLDDGCGHRDGSDDSEIDDDGDEDDDVTIVLVTPRSTRTSTSSTGCRRLRGLGVSSHCGSF